MSGVPAGEALRFCAAPAPRDVAPTASGFLEQLGGPSWITVPGRDRSRSRVLVTLLHGNEPSGLHALHRLLCEGLQPAVDIHACVAAVATALEPPLFSHRHLPGIRDLNRCFHPPFEDRPGRLAGAILQSLDAHRPEALLDLHNTSGAGPAFAVAISEDARHDALVRLFSRRLVITDLRLGALMEYAERAVPTVTIECGGAGDPEADAVALRGLYRYWSEPELFRPGPSVQVLRHPLRLELRSGAVLGYGDGHRGGDDLTLPFDVERFNFAVTHAGAALGWLGPSGLAPLRLVDARGEVAIDEWFGIRGGQLACRDDLILFMVTTDPDIARSDCIGYLVRAGTVG